MRILFVSSEVLPHVGGVDTYCHNLKTYLEAWGHQVDVLAYGPEKRSLQLTGGPSIERALIGEPVERAVRNFYAPLLRGAGDEIILRREALRYTFELAAALFPLGRYHVIHAHDVVACRAIARVGPPGVPLVASINGLFSEELPGMGTLRGRKTHALQYVEMEERVGSRSADRIILPSRWIRSRALKKWEVPSSRVSVIPYGLDLQRFIRAGGRASAPIPDPGGRKVLLTHARLAREKGQGLLLDALRILIKRRRDFVLWLAGDGPTRGPLLQKAALNGLAPYVEVLGNREDVPALLRRATLAVLPSRVDNLPHSIMEAQVAGVPVVATRVGGIPEMILDGETGVLVPPENPRALASAIEQLLEDPAGRRRIGARAAEWGRMAWDGRRMALSTLDVYRSAIEARGERHGQTAVSGAGGGRSAPGGGVSGAVGAPGPSPKEPAAGGTSAARPLRIGGPDAEHRPAAGGGRDPGENTARELPAPGPGLLQGHPTAGTAGVQGQGEAQGAEGNLTAAPRVLAAVVRVPLAVPEVQTVVAVPPDVAVVIPVRNPGPHLTEALRSVMGQTWPGWQIVLVEDGSTEDLSRWVPGDLPPSRISRVRLAGDQGPAAGLNAALEQVATPYLLQMGADDRLAPEALATLRGALEASPPDVCLVSANSRVVFVKEERGRSGRGRSRRGRGRAGGSGSARSRGDRAQPGRSQPGGPGRTSRTVGSQLWQGRAFHDRYAFLLLNRAVWPRFYRTAALRAVGGWPADGPDGGRLLEDRRILYRLIEKYRFGWVDRNLYLQRRHLGRSGLRTAEQDEALRHAVEEALRRWGAEYQPVFETDEVDGSLVVTRLEPLAPDRSPLRREMFPQLVRLGGTPPTKRRNRTPVRDRQLSPPGG